MMDAVSLLGTDARYAARMLAKSPGFTLLAAGLLAAGIGATTVIFSAVDAVMLRPLPVKHPEELVRMVQITPQLGTRSSFSYLFYENLRDHATALSAVFGEQEEPVAMNQPWPAEELRVTLVTPEFFEALGVPAMYGRTLTRADASEAPGAPPAVLSYAFWRRRFNANPSAIGQMITLKGQKFAIVGVMPREFNGISADTSPDVRVPIRVIRLLRDNGNGEGRHPEQLANLSIAARLGPRVSRAEAQDQCLPLFRASAVEFANRYFHDRSAEVELRRGMQLEPIERGVSILRDKFGTALMLLVASVGLLLLIVCANVAGLLLARGAARREEIAVRLALGATRPRIARQMLTESALLALIGAIGGLLLAWISAPLITRLFPPLRDLYTERLRLAIRVGIDGRLLAFSIAISCACVLLAGLAPAISLARTNLDAVLRGARSASGWHGRQALIVFQIALCTTLLAGAGLLMRTFAQLRGLDAGFDSEHIVTFTANPELESYTEAQARSLWSALTGRVREIPGVESVAVASRPLMRGSGIKTTVAPVGERTTDQDFLNTSINSVSQEYFRTMRMRIVDGRDFIAEDASRKDRPLPRIVNQAFVRKFLPHTEPVGRLFGGGRGDEPVTADYEIVGVVSDAKYRSLREPMTPTVYSIWAPGGDPFQLLVRTSARPESVIDPVRRALASIDPALPFTEINTMSAEIDASVAPERTTATLASLFGISAALLAAVGIYGLLAYAVTQRRREIGIRMAIGARSADIAVMIGSQALVMAVAGVVMGLAAAFVTAPWIRSLLYGVAPSDPATLIFAALFVIFISAIAAALPALRAARVEPAIALREENA